MNLSRYFEWLLFRDILAKEGKEDDYLLLKDFVHVFEVLYKNKTRIVTRKQSYEELAFDTRL